MRLRVLILLCIPLIGLAQTGPANLGFETGTPGQTPPGWSVPTAGYAAEIRHEGCKNGVGCAILSLSAGGSAAPFGNIMQTFAADAFRGKTVRLRAWIRVEKTDAADRAQVWFRVDRPGRQVGFFDNMGDRPIKSSDWQGYEIIGDIEADAVSINIGVMSFGKARVWIDDMGLEIIPVAAEDIAARKEFQKLYKQIDSAYESASMEQLAAMALPNAESRSGSIRQPLSVVIAEIKASLEKGNKVSNKTAVDSARLYGDNAVVSAKTNVGIASSGDRQDYVFTYRDMWTLTADGWKLKERLIVSFRAVASKTDPMTVKAVVAELKQRAVPLATVEAGAKTDDLAAFGKAVGDARIVALGEASHGTHEFFQMKHRLLEYLVKEKGFTVFAIEANWPETLAVDRYIKAGEGDVKTAMSKMYFWTWYTEEVRDMIEWMRAYNQKPGDHPTLSFSAFDMQTGQVAAQQALDYLKQYSAEEAPAAEAAYTEVRRIDAAGMTDSRAKGASEQAAAVLRAFDSKRAAMEKSSSPAAWRDARQAAAVAYQACTMRIPGNSGAYRDEMMARNVEWLADEVFPNEKIVLWAHNGHVRFGAEGGRKSMGTWLRDRFARKMYVTGFAFRRGQLRAVGQSSGRSSGLALHQVPPAPERSGDAVLSAAEMPIFFLDMSSIPADSPLGRWLAQSHLHYNVGAVWQTADPEANLSTEKLSKEYDGLIFIEESRAARSLGGQK
jgi:erythromycin esterase